MSDMPQDIAGLLQILGLAALGLLVVIGQWHTRRSTPSQQSSPSSAGIVAGALVDSSSVQALTKAIREQTEANKRLAESGEDIAKALSVIGERECPELRATIRDFVMVMARRP